MNAPPKFLVFLPTRSKNEFLLEPAKTKTTHNEGDDVFFLGAGGRRAYRGRGAPLYVILGALLAALLAIVFLITLCSSVQRKRKLPPSSLVHRKLSDGKDSSLDGSFSRCAPTTTDDAASSSSEISASSSEDQETAETATDVKEEGSEPPVKKVRLEPAAPTESAETSRGPSSAPSADMQHATAPQPQQEPLESYPQPELEPAAVAGPSFFPPSPPPSQQEGPVPPHSSLQRKAPQVPDAPHISEFPIVDIGPRDPAELDAAQALLLLRQPPPSAGAAGPATVRTEEQTRPEEPFFAADESGMGAAAAEGVLIDPGEGPSGVGVPSEPSAPLVKHAFFHAPSLKPGVTTRRFNVNRAGSEDLAYAKPNVFLSIMESLLSKETLDAQQAEAIVALAEQLAAHCLFKQNAEVANMEPGGAAENLAIRFLLFDSIVAGLMAVRQTVPVEFWRRLIAAVPHTFVSKTGSGAQGPPGSRYRELAVRLSAALEILKTGKRPPAREVIDLKKMIFCSEFRLRKFKSKAFDSWKSHCDDEAPSDPGTS